MAAAGDEVKLIGAWPSPFVLRSRIALNLKGVVYDFLEEPFGAKSELLLKSNPVFKKIPVLLHNGRAISESMIIVNYIDDAWTSSGPNILPVDPYDIAAARFWAVYVDDKIFSVMKRMVLASTEESMAEAAEQLHPALEVMEEAFEKCSRGQAFFGGDNIGYLDIALGSLVGWLKALEEISGVEFLGVEKTPLLLGWAERFCADAAVKKVMPEKERLVEFRSILLAKYGDPAPPSQ